MKIFGNKALGKFRLEPVVNGGIPLTIYPYFIGRFCRFFVFKETTQHFPKKDIEIADGSIEVPHVNAVELKYDENPPVKEQK